jgi:hypothetical protein
MPPSIISHFFGSKRVSRLGYITEQSISLPSTSQHDSDSQILSPLLTSTNRTPSPPVFSDDSRSRNSVMIRSRDVLPDGCGTSDSLMCVTKIRRPSSGGLSGQQGSVPSLAVLTSHLPASRPLPAFSTRTACPEGRYVQTSNVPVEQNHTSIQSASISSMSIRSWDDSQRSRLIVLDPSS